MDIGIIAPIENLMLEGNEFNFFNFEGFNISRDREILLKHFGSPFKDFIGLSEQERLFSNPFIYQSGTSQDLFNKSKTNNLRDLCEASAILLDNFIFCLWFIKDNSVFLNKLYINLYDSDTNATPLSTTYHHRYSNCTGESMPTSFNSTQIFEFIPAIFLSVLQVLPEISNSGTPLKQLNRLQRSGRFLNDARKTETLTQKITNYVSIIECLFATQNNDSINKIFDRATFFIGGTDENKKRNYNLMTAAYEISSGYSHGETLSAKIDDNGYLKDISKSIDGIIRDILLKIIIEGYKIFSLPHNGNTTIDRRDKPNTDILDEYLMALSSGVVLTDEIYVPVSPISIQTIPFYRQ